MIEEEIEYGKYEKMVKEWDKKNQTATLIFHAFDHGPTCVRIANHIRNIGYVVTIGIGNSMHRQIKVQRKTA